MKDWRLIPEVMRSIEAHQKGEKPRHIIFTAPAGFGKSMAAHWKIPVPYESIGAMTEAGMIGTIDRDGLVYKGLLANKKIYHISEVNAVFNNPRFVRMLKDGWITKLTMTDQLRYPIQATLWICSQPREFSPEVRKAFDIVEFVPDKKWMRFGPQKDEKVLALVSGGLDSTTMLRWILTQGYKPIALTFNYGQRHVREVRYAQDILRELGLRQHIHSIMPIQGASAIEGRGEVPKEDYSVETQKATVSPNRNMIFLAIAAKYALIHGCRRIFYAAHHNDEAVYPDCRPEFVEALNNALDMGNYDPVWVEAPFIGMTKADIVRLGNLMGIDFSKTWSCYDPVPMSDTPHGIIHCGRCGTCRERKMAFKTAGVTDPTRYAA